MVVDASVWVRAIMPKEEHHQSSKRFLQSAIRRGVMIHAPVLVPVEVGASIIRRTHDHIRARQVVRDILVMPLVTLYPVDTPLMLRSIRLAFTCELRGADAIYAALADALQMPLVSWDGEHLQRAGTHIAVYTTDTAPLA